MRRAKALASNATPSLPSIPSFGMLKDKVGIRRGGSFEDIDKPKREAAVRQRSITDFTDVKLQALNSEIATKFQQTKFHISSDSDQSSSLEM